MTVGDILTLDIDKAVAGGRTLARHAGAIVLVAGAVPGEVVEARVERVQHGTVWARTVRVVTPSSDRERDSACTCGGNVLAHIRYERQLSLKSEIVQDAFTRLAHLPLRVPVVVTPSPREGYRMRARVHVQGGRVGFYHEGTRQLCEAATTGQLHEDTLAVLAALQERVAAAPGTWLAEVEIAEDREGTQRALHFIPHRANDHLPHSDWAQLTQVPRVAGASVETRTGARVLWGDTWVSDTLSLTASAGGRDSVTIGRRPHAFFQGNRFLLQPFVDAVVAQVPAGRVVDLYAGVGLFSLPLAARGTGEVTAVEGDRAAVADLRENARHEQLPLSIRHAPVEQFAPDGYVPDAVLADPPRTGLSSAALQAVLKTRTPHLVYVSCDVPTLARDTRRLVDGGYEMTSIAGFDLFPNTAHVELVAVFTRQQS